MPSHGRRSIHIGIEDAILLDEVRSWYHSQCSAWSSHSAIFKRSLELLAQHIATNPDPEEEAQALARHGYVSMSPHGKR